MKSKKRPEKQRQGYIVRSTSFQKLKRASEVRRGTTKQRKIGKDSYEVTSYRNHTKIVTTLRIVTDKDQVREVFDKDFKRFEKSKKFRDFGGSVQRFNGRIKTVRQGRVHIKGEVTKSSHLYSVSKKHTKRKKDRGAEFFNKRIDTLNELDSYTFEQYR